MKIRTVIILVLALCCHSFAGVVSLDSFEVPLSMNDFHVKNRNWEKRFARLAINFNEKVLDSSSNVCYKANYTFLALPTKIWLQAEGIGEDSTRVIVKYESYGGKKMASRWNTNIGYTIAQECGIEVDGTKPLTKKSPAVYFSLAMLNIGLGSYYSAYKSPVSPRPTALNALITVLDAGLVAGCFVGNEGGRQASLTFWGLYKAIGLLGFLNIKSHNELYDSRYKYLY